MVRLSSPGFSVSHDNANVCMCATAELVCPSARNAVEVLRRRPTRFLMTTLLRSSSIQSLFICLVTLGNLGCAARILVCKGHCSEVLSVITQRELKEKEAFFSRRTECPFTLRRFWRRNLTSKQKTFRDKVIDAFERGEKKNSLISPLSRMVHVRDGVSATHSVYLHGVRCADSKTLPLPCVVFLPSGPVWVYWRVGRE